MRILRIAQKLYPDVPGGGPYHVHAMSRDQADLGHDVTVATVAQDDDRPAVEDRDGYTIKRFSPVAKPLGNAVAPGIARALRRANEFDVVHAHSHLYFSTNLAAMNRWLGETPLAITNHGLYSQTAPEWVFEGYLRTLGRWTFNRADLVFCYTDTDRQRLRDRGVRADISVVANGIDTERFAPAGPTSELVEGNGPTALFVGRFVEGKRPEAAIRAVAQARETDPALTLVLCGEGPLREDLEGLAEELGVEDAVRFLGQVPYGEMPAVYRSADVLVLPSRSEGVPRTVLEAMASGIPVVCSQLAQLEGIVERDGRGELVDVESEGELAAAIRRWLAAETRPTPLDDEFAWERTVTATTAKLEGLVD